MESVKTETPAVKRQRLAAETPDGNAEISARTPFVPPPGEALDYLKLVTSGDAPRTVLVCGDVYGRVDTLHAKLIELRNEVDFVLAVGQFLPPNAVCSRIEDYVGANALRVLPVPVYFIDSASEMFIKKAEEARRPLQLQPNLSFMGSCGVVELHGLQIAYLSGSYDPDVFKQLWGRGIFSGSHYTSAAVETPGYNGGSLYVSFVVLVYIGSCSSGSPTSRLPRKLEKQAALMQRRGRQIDILLTSEWPDKVWSSHAKKWVAPVVRPACASPAVSRLVARLRPQYHVHATADRFSKVRVERREGSTTSLALAHVRDRPTDSMHDQLKWCEVLLIRPAPQKPLAPVIVDIEEDDGLVMTKSEPLQAKAESENEGAAAAA